MGELAADALAEQTGDDVVVDLRTSVPEIDLTQPDSEAPKLTVVADRWQPHPGFRYGGRRLLFKRLIDKAVAAAALVLLAPAMVALAITVKLTSPGPAVFRQQRVGRFGEPFEILKFRTMHVDAEGHLRRDPALWAAYVDNDYKLEMEDDPRVTRIGRFLRRSSLDELPQFINVLRGEMSLVGPRPVLQEELEAYGEWVEAYLHVYPGLTGIWQVEGRNDVTYPERALLDVRYADEWSLGSDISLAVRTIPAVLTSSGVK